jgi:hypothetical protein
MNSEPCHSIPHGPQRRAATDFRFTSLQLLKYKKNFFFRVAHHGKLPEHVLVIGFPAPISGVDRFAILPRLEHYIIAATLNLCLHPTYMHMKEGVCCALKA